MNTSAKSLLAAAAASVVASVFFAAPAKAELVDACRLGDRTKLETCCRHYIKVHGTPLWMMNSNSTCESVVSCAKPAKGTRRDKCAIVPNIPTGGGNNNRTPSQHFTGKP